MKIESTDQDIRQLFSQGWYRIPRFQRPYSWEIEHIREFWKDVVQSSSDYFIGSMVVFEQANQVYGVVDGQQRLTTITLLLCALRNQFSELGETDLAEGIHGLIERKNIDNKNEFILTPESSYPYFQHHIQKWGEPDIDAEEKREEKALKAAFNELTVLVKGSVDAIAANPATPEKKKIEEIRKSLQGIRDAVLNLKVIFVRLDNEDDAYIIFETLNTRGKDLSLADLVKNYFTKLTPNKSQSLDSTKIKWEKILETIEGAEVDLDTDTYIHHFWLSRYDYIPAKKLFKEFKRRVKKAEATSYLDALVADAAHYRSIHETAYGEWSNQELDIKRSLDALQLYRVRQQTPCVLSLVRKYRNNEIRARTLKTALQAIENFHFLFTAVTSQRSSGGISGMYAALARKLYEAYGPNDSAEVIKELKEKLRDRVPTRDEVIALFPELMYTDNFTKQRNLIRYILTRLKVSDEGGKYAQYITFTIEHLVPQAEIQREVVDEATIGQVGNLMLVPEEINQKLKEKELKEKIKILDAGGIVVPPEFREKGLSKYDAIKQRTKRIAGKAYDEVWKI